MVRFLVLFVVFLLPAAPQPSSRSISEESRDSCYDGPGCQLSEIDFEIQRLRQDKEALVNESTALETKVRNLRREEKELNIQIEKLKNMSKISTDVKSVSVGSYNYTFSLTKPLGVQVTKSFDDSSECYCLDTGSEYTRLEKLYVAGMKIYFRSWGDNATVIGAIEVTYNYTSKFARHGSDDFGRYNNKPHAHFVLRENDRIVNVTAKAGDMIDQLTFGTRHGKVHGPFGGTGGTVRSFSCDEPGCYLAYMTGSVVKTYDYESVRDLRFAWGYKSHKSASK